MIEQKRVRREVSYIITDCGDDGGCIFHKIELGHERFCCNPKVADPKTKLAPKITLMENFVDKIDENSPLISGFPEWCPLKKV